MASFTKFLKKYNYLIEDIVSMEKINKYLKEVRLTFKDLKSIRVFDELISRSIRLDNDLGYLVCISELHADDRILIEQLAQWRKNATTFHNKFNVTFDSTQRWLRALLLDIPDRILFLVLNRHGHPIGHMGFANALNNEACMEFDNVIRGVSGQDSGLMSVATRSLLSWANKVFQPSNFYIRTLDDNFHAIEFYERLGFVVCGKQPLRRIENNGEINHVPLSEGDENPPDRYFVCMELDICNLVTS